MLYFVEQGAVEKMILQQCVREGKPIPDRIQAAPTLITGLELFYLAFGDLFDSRDKGRPISWITIHQYCQAKELNELQSECMHYHIRRMDSAYLNSKSGK